MPLDCGSYHVRPVSNNPNDVRPVSNNPNASVNMTQGVWEVLVEIKYTSNM